MIVACLTISSALALGATGDLADLIQSLGAKRYAERQQAADALIKLGPDAAPALQTALASPDPEIRNRAADLLETIGTLPLLQPRLYTLNAGPARLDAIVADLGSQLGGGLRLDPEQTALARARESEFTVKAQTTAPFWETMTRLREATGLELDLADRVDRREGKAAATLELAKTRVPASLDRGMFRVEVLHINRRSEEIVLRMRVRAEPGLMLRAPGLVTELAAFDETGREVKTNGSGREPLEVTFADADIAGGAQFLVSLKNPGAGVATLSRLRGSIPVTVGVRRPEPVQKLAMEFIDGKWQEVDDLFVTARRMPRGNGATRIICHLLIQRKISGYDSTPPDLVGDQLELVDSAGKVMVPASTTAAVFWGGMNPGMARRGTRGSTYRTYTFNPDESTPAELHFYTYRQAHTEVEFEFRDLKLP